MLLNSQMKSTKKSSSKEKEEGKAEVKEKTSDPQEKDLVGRRTQEAEMAVSWNAQESNLTAKSVAVNITCEGSALMKKERAKASQEEAQQVHPPHCVLTMWQRLTSYESTVRITTMNIKTLS